MLGATIMQDALEALKRAGAMEAARLHDVVAVTILGSAKECTNVVFDDASKADIETFRSYDGCREGSVAVAVDGSVTYGGTIILENVLYRPISDVTRLRARQRALRGVRAVFRANRDATAAALAAMQENEEAFAWFASARTAEELELFSTVYFSVGCLDGSRHALDARAVYKILLSPAIGILSPVVYFIIPYLIVRIKLGLRVGLADYVKLMYQSTGALMRGGGGVGKVMAGSYLFSMAFYFQSIFTTLEVSSMYRSVLELMHRRCLGLSRFAGACDDLVRMYGAHAFAADWGVPTAEGSGTVPHVPEHFNPLRDAGTVQVAFRDVDVRSIAPLATRGYLIDALLGVLATAERERLTFAEFLEGHTSPTVKARSSWHVCLGASAVRNSLQLGGDTAPNSAIITGPNAGGKSTFVKSVLVNVLLAQTFGLVAARRFALTPFARVSSQMNVPDCKGRESLFEAEMNRCKAKLDMIDESDGHVLLALDEVFSSTEPTEGQAGAYAVAQAIVSSPRVVCLLTTHYRGLCELADEEDVENYRMPVERGADDAIIFPYKLEKGVSDQHIALELLRRKGFDATIVDAAISRLASLRGQNT